MLLLDNAFLISNFEVILQDAVGIKTESEYRIQKTGVRIKSSQLSTVSVQLSAATGTELIAEWLDVQDRCTIEHIQSFNRYDSVFYIDDGND